MRFASLLDAFGARPTGARLARILRSPQWHDGAFRNSVPTQKSLPGTFWRTLRLQLFGGEERVSAHSLPVRRVSAADAAAPPASGLRATWLGHSTTLLHTDGMRVLLDPVWAERASPFRTVGPKRFHEPPLALADLPSLDVVLISHDHYDHLDMDAVRALVGHRGPDASRLLQWRFRPVRRLCRHR